MSKNVPTRPAMMPTGLDGAPPPIPDYELVRRLGAGGFGEVWLGRSKTGVYRAVKMHHKARLREREFRAIRDYERQIRGEPHLIDVLQVGETAEHFYYVTELADGITAATTFSPEHYVPHTLRGELERKGHLGLQEATEIVSAVLEGLASLHARELLHRNIKPANVLFLAGVAKLGEVGVPSRGNRDDPELQPTPYVPPEGVRCPSGDLYCLGRMLFELLSGMSPERFPELPDDATDEQRSALQRLAPLFDKACAPNPGDRFQTAGEFLAAMRDPGAALPQTRTGGLATATMVKPAAAAPAGVFHGYEIIREISRGGQGAVYEAIQKATKRKVAVKVMLQGAFAGVRERQRFEREVEILAQLKHPNIVTIHDSGTADGKFYYVMDFIPGQSLDDYVANSGIGVTEALALFRKICSAVNSAHLLGVIHRDLKPGNIRIGEDGEPYILDFGLAKSVPGGTGYDDGQAGLSLTGQFLGSLPWASPEQAEGIPSKIDLRTDVYALGVILYQMLTGKFPYEVAGNIRDVLDNILNAVPARPSTVRRRINNEVETIVLKCLSKEAERRYQNAGELARDIERYLAGEAIEAKRDSALYVIRKLVLRHAVATAVACLVLVLFISFGLIYFDLDLRRRSVQRAKEKSDAAALESSRLVSQAADAYAMPALREMKLGWFVAAWQDDRLARARAIQRGVKRDSPEYKAMAFLLDQSMTPDALLSEIPAHYATTAHFVIGLRHLKAGEEDAAATSFRRSLESNRGSIWIVSEARAHLKGLGACGSKMQEQGR